MDESSQIFTTHVLTPNNTHTSIVTILRKKSSDRATHNPPSQRTPNNTNK